MSNLFIVILYIPHKGRKRAPYVKDVIEQLHKLLVTQYARQTVSF